MDRPLGSQWVWEWWPNLLTPALYRELQTWTYPTRSGALAALRDAYLKLNAAEQGDLPNELAAELTHSTQETT